MHGIGLVFGGLAMAAAIGWSPSAGAEGATDAAAECTALAGSPNDLGLTGGVLFDSIETARAIPACEKAVAETPADGRLHFQLGRALDQAKRYDEAMQAYQAAVDRGFMLAASGIGGLYEYGDGVTQDYAKAAESYQKGADAGEPRGMVDLGVIYENGWGRPKDTARAQRLYLDAIAKGRPTTVALAQNQLAYTFAKENIRLDEAATFARAAVTDAETSGVDHASRLDTLALVLYRQGRHDEALAVQLKAIGLLEKEQPVYFARVGDIYEALGRHGEARAAWQKALDLPVDASTFDVSYDIEALKAKLAGKTPG